MGHGGIIGLADVDAVAAGVIADDFGEDIGAAGEGVIAGFQDDDAGAFAADQAVAFGVEGSRGVGRGIVERGGGRVEDVEGTDDGFVEFFGAAAEDDVLSADADLVVGGADGLKARRARRRGGRDDAFDAEELGDVQGDGVGDAAEEFAGAEQEVFILARRVS